MTRPGDFGATRLTPEQFERIGRALAHVVLSNEGDEVVLGQAWLAGPGAMITCGHVVDQFVSDPGVLAVRFPSSGKRYPVRKIKVHPRFVRQPDQLVKFDVALLLVHLTAPEASVPPLPFSYETPFEKNQMLTAVRYPVHLGALTDAPEPITQGGKLLGHLHKQDDFHWLHDLALAPGDSGAALFHGPRVAAIHCGDTATLPGLNLPTTAIRMALRVDALKEIGLSETSAPMIRSKHKPVVSAAVAFVASLLISFMLAAAGLTVYKGKDWAVEFPTILPVDIKFNEPVLGYKPNEPIVIDLIPHSDCNLYLFQTSENGVVYCIQPMKGFSAEIKAGHTRSIREFGGRLLTAGPSKDKLQLVALISGDPLVKETDWSKTNPDATPLTIKADALLTRIKEFEKLEPDNVLHIELDAPRAL